MAHRPHYNGQRTTDDPVRLAAAHVAIAARWKLPQAEIDDRRITLAEAQIRRDIERAVASAPPLPDDVRARLAALLAPVERERDKS